MGFVKERIVAHGFKSMFSTVLISSFIVILIITNLLKFSQVNNHQLQIIDQNVLTAKFAIDGKMLSLSQVLSDVLNKSSKELLYTKEKNFFIKFSTMKCNNIHNLKLKYYFFNS